MPENGSVRLLSPSTPTHEARTGLVRSAPHAAVTDEVQRFDERSEGW